MSRRSGRDVRSVIAAAGAWEGRHCCVRRASERRGISVIVAATRRGRGEGGASGVLPLRGRDVRGASLLRVRGVSTAWGMSSRRERGVIAAWN